LRNLLDLARGCDTVTQQWLPALLLLGLLLFELALQTAVCTCSPLFNPPPAAANASIRVHACKARSRLGADSAANSKQGSPVAHAAPAEPAPTSKDPAQRRPEVVATTTVSSLTTTSTCKARHLIHSSHERPVAWLKLIAAVGREAGGRVCVAGWSGRIGSCVIGKHGLMPVRACL
jgi:hypothetical protein